MSYAGVTGCDIVRATFTHPTIIVHHTGMWTGLTLPHAPLRRASILVQRALFTANQPLGARRDGSQRELSFVHLNRSEAFFADALAILNRLHVWIFAPIAGCLVTIWREVLIKHIQIMIRA